MQVFSGKNILRKRRTFISIHVSMRAAKPSNLNVRTSRLQKQGSIETQYSYPGSGRTQNTNQSASWSDQPETGSTGGIYKNTYFEKQRAFLKQCRVAVTLIRIREPQTTASFCLRADNSGLVLQ